MARPAKPHTPFAARLIEARSSLSREEFANLLAVPLSTLRNWEQGKAVPPHEALARIREVLDVSLDWLLTGEGERIKGPSLLEPLAKLGATPAALDADLMGFVLEGVQTVYREENSRIDPRNAGRLAARIYDDIVAACQGDDDPAARKAALRMALQQLRRDLHAHDGTTETKRQA
jgi:transcriptional regulator with XRE-family HTH domain